MISKSMTNNVIILSIGAYMFWIENLWVTPYINESIELEKHMHTWTDCESCGKGSIHEH